MVGAPTASLGLVALPDDSAFGGNAVIPFQKFERGKSGRRVPCNTVGDLLADWNRVASDVSNSLPNCTPLRAMLTDQIEATGATSVLQEAAGGRRSRANEI